MSDRKKRMDEWAAIALLVLVAFCFGAATGNYFARYRLEVSVKTVEREGGPRE